MDALIERAAQAANRSINATRRGTAGVNKFIGMSFFSAAAKGCIHQNVHLSGALKYFQFKCLSAGLSALKLFRSCLMVARLL